MECRFNMNKDISVNVVRAIIQDIYGRYGLEQYFRNLKPENQVEIYENWIAVVSRELKKGGVIEEEYQPLKVNEMSFVEIVNRTSYYLKND